MFIFMASTAAFEKTCALKHRSKPIQNSIEIEISLFIHYSDHIYSLHLLSVFS